MISNDTAQIAAASTKKMPSEKPNLSRSNSCRGSKTNQNGSPSPAESAGAPTRSLSSLIHRETAPYQEIMAAKSTPKRASPTTEPSTPRSAGGPP